MSWLTEATDKQLEEADEIVKDIWGNKDKDKNEEEDDDDSADN